MKIISILRFISSHPLNEKNKISSILRFLTWQITSRLNPYPKIYQFTSKSKLIIRKGMDGATGNLYCGLHDYNDMAFLLHFLRPEDLFVDIGANIGSYTVLASSHVGAKSFAFEPIPSTFTHLINNIAINQMTDKVSAFNIAIGSQTGCLEFTSTKDCRNRVAGKNETDTINVPVNTLDEILHNSKAPNLLKIDVEGWETEVIKGAWATLAQTDLKAIIIELRGSGTKYNFDENQIHNILLKLKFKGFQYHPKKRELTPLDKFGTHNTIYVRDLKFVSERLHTAPKIKIRDVEF